MPPAPARVDRTPRPIDAELGSPEPSGDFGTPRQVLSHAFPGMVRISDEEKSQFDAPLDVLWKYLQHPEAHGNAHKNARNRAMRPLTDTSFIVSWEQDMNGRWVKISNKITVFPPLGMASEQLEGPLAGSRMFTVYTPRGAKTEVAVYGDMQSSALPPDQLEPMVRMAWESAFKEDSEGIRAFAKK